MRLIVFDTLGLTFDLIDDNSNNHMRSALQIIKTFAEKHECLALVITHPPKSRGARKGMTKGAFDPACGSGAFLVAAFDFLHAEYTRVNDRLTTLKGGMADLFDLDKEILNQNLYGVDINPESIEITKLSLWLKTAKRGKVLNSLDHTLRVGNSVIADKAYAPRAFDWKDAFPEVFKAGGFDVVLGNPPYVRQERFSECKPYLQTHYGCYHGVTDLYAFFYELGLNLLRDGGRLGYISSGTFFKSSSGEPLRNLLREKSAIHSVVDFGDLQVFEGVTTYPVIMVLEKSPPAKKQEMQYLALKKAPETDLSKEFASHAQQMQQSSLSSESWNLGDASVLSLREKITKGKKTLKEVYGSPLYGIKTGLTEAFVISEDTRNQIIAQSSNAVELIKPFLIGDHMARWHSQPEGLNVILIPKGWTREQSGHTDEAAAWAWFSSKYPSLAEWLEPFADKGRKRTDKGEFWWELRACAYYDEFEKPKILYPEFSQGAKFTLDKHPTYFNNKVFFLPTEDFTLLGILNSRAVWYYLLGICSALRGGVWRLELRTQYIETISIPTVSKAQKETIGALAEQCQKAAEELHTLSTKFVHLLKTDFKLEKPSTKLEQWYSLDFAGFLDELKKKKIVPTLTQKSEWMDYFEKQKATAQSLKQTITKLEQELNQQVYALYALTPEEIQIIEEATS